MKGKHLILGAGLAMIILTLGMLLTIKQRQALQAPGVKVGPVAIYDVGKKPVADHSVLLPEKILDGVSTNNGPIDSTELSGLPADTTFGRRAYFFPDGFSCTVSAILMGTDRSSIHQPQFCVVGQGWNIDTTEIIDLQFDRPHRFTVPAIQLTSSIRYTNTMGAALARSIYIYWFVSKDRFCTGQFDRMWSTIRTLLSTGEMERWAYISCFAVCAPGNEAATAERMKKILSAGVPDFQTTTGPQQIGKQASVNPD